MIITTTPNDLNTAFKTISGTIASIDETTQNILFKKEGSSVVLTTTNYTSFSKTTLKCSCEGDGDFAIEYKRLSMWLKAIGKTTEVTLTYKDGSVVAKSKGSKSKLMFPSLDTEKLPETPKSLDDESETAKCSADRLYNALKYLKSSVYKDDTRPNLSLVECRNGSLLASDSISMSTLFLDGFENCTLKVQAQEIGNLISFLGSQGDEELSIREGDSAIHFVTKGAEFGLNRYNFAFPDFNPENTEASWETWSVNVDEAKTALAMLSATSDFDIGADKLVVDLKKHNGLVRIETLGMSGEKDYVDITLYSNDEDSNDEDSEVEEAPVDEDSEVEDSNDEDSDDEDSEVEDSEVEDSEVEGSDDEGAIEVFSVSHKRFLDILNRHLSDHIELDLARKGRGGMLRVQTSSGKDLYSTYLAWVFRG